MNSEADIERELIETFIAALKKGMTAEEFFAMADTTMEHLRGRAKNETIEKIINNTATSEEVERMIASLNK
jgi:hydroxypyruvate isomerase